MKVPSETNSLFNALRKSSKPKPVSAIEKLIRDRPDSELCRINALAFAAKHKLNEEDVIAAFLHGARLGIFDMSWNILCPACGGVLDSGATLKTVKQAEYTCVLCAEDCEPTLDEIVEVTFTISPRVRRIAAHDPGTLPFIEYYRQVFWSSGVDLPDDEALARWVKETTLDAVELSAGEKVVLSLQMPEGYLIVFDPVLHMFQHIEVTGEPARESQSLSFVMTRDHAPSGTIQMRPGALWITLENRLNVRTLPAIWIVTDKVHDLVSKRRPFLTAKRLLTNQTFRDIYRTDTLDVDQRLKITSLSFPVYRPQRLNGTLRTSWRFGRLRFGARTFPDPERNRRGGKRRRGKDNRGRHHGDVPDARPSHGGRAEDARSSEGLERRLAA